MTSPRRLLPFAIGMAAAFGCAPVPRTSRVGPARMPDCSFRAASTCWTMAGRFPARRPVAKDTTPDIRTDHSPAVLAITTDSLDHHADTHMPTESYR